MLLGLPLAASINCLALLNGALGLAAMTTGTRPIKDTATKSRSASNGAGWYSDILAAKALAAIINV